MGIRGKKAEEDPQKGLNSVRNNMSTQPGGAGFINRGTAGNHQSQPALEGINPQQWLAQNGLDASAEVLAITETDMQINQNTVVVITLKVQPAMIAPDFKTTGKAMVSREAIPHVGDRLRLKYNPANLTQFIVLSK